MNRSENKIKYHRFKMWHKFAIITTIIILIYLGCFSVIMMLLYRHYDISSQFTPFILLLIISLSISAITTSIVSHIFIHPIDDISEAMRRVATGDFSVRLSEEDEFTNIESMNSSFNLMVKELNSTEMLKTDFITNVSHEIKTPLAAIEGYASLLSATELNREQSVYTRNIIESASKLSTLTGNILRLSKLENQQFPDKKTTFPLDEQIRQSILLLESSWSKKNLDIEPELEAVNFTGYENLLPHVWNNLISNAVKFTPQNGCISFDLHTVPGGVSISISDNGIGMTEDEAAHAFDKFYQAENNHSTSGNGLGLPLVKQIISMHNGTIKIKSAPDEGSTFEIFLPQ